MSEHTIQIIGLWITGVGVAVGIGVLIVYICQLNAMRGQLRGMERQADALDKQTEILGKSVEAAEDAAAAAQKGIELQTRPRLHIESIKVLDFDVGKRPFLFVELSNSGPVTAENVAINIRVDSGPGTDGVKWSREQIVAVPANSSRKYFIRWKAPLTITEHGGFKSDVPLRVTGYYQVPGSDRVDYCYKYNPCDGPKPEDWPEFIPCDFNPGLTILMTADPGKFNLADGSASFTVTRNPDGPYEHGDDDNPDPSKPTPN